MTTRRATSLSLDSELIEAAKSLDIDLSQAAERGIALEVGKRRGDDWNHENRAAIDAWNKYIDEHGVPLARFRQF